MNREWKINNTEPRVLDCIIHCHPSETDLVMDNSGQHFTIRALWRLEGLPSKVFWEINQPETSQETWLKKTPSVRAGLGGMSDGSILYEIAVSYERGIWDLHIYGEAIRWHTRRP